MVPWPSKLHLRWSLLNTCWYPVSAKETGESTLDAAAGDVIESEAPENATPSSRG